MKGVRTVKAFMIYNGRTVGRRDMDFTCEGIPTLSLRHCAEVSGATIRWKPRTQRVQLSYCGRKLDLSVSTGDLASGFAQNWIEVPMLADFLQVNWRLEENNKLLLMGRREESLAGKRIVVDVGPGGDDEDQGLTSSKDQQPDFVIGRVLAGLLQVAGAEVVTTWGLETYPSLQERLGIASSFAYHAFICLHCNHHPSSKAQGTEVYHYESHPSARLAMYTLNQLVEELGTRNRGVKEAGFYLLRQLPEPALLLKVGFLSNPQDGKILREPQGQYRSAAAIFRGIREFFEEKPPRRP